MMSNALHPAQDPNLMGGSDCRRIMEEQGDTGAGACTLHSE